MIKESNLIVLLLFAMTVLGNQLKWRKMGAGWGVFVCLMDCYASRAEMFCVLIARKGPCPVNPLAPTVAGFCVPVLKRAGFCMDSLPCPCANVCWLRAERTCLTSRALVMPLNSNGGGDLMK